MNKLNLIILLLFPITISAQLQLSPNGMRVKSDKFIAPQSLMSKSVGSVLWSNNFDQPADWIIDNDGQSTAGYGWSIDQSVDADWWYSSGINSSSGGNFAELGNGNYDLNDQAVNVEYTLKTANPIDLTVLGADDFILSFEQSGARFNDLQELQISVDGSNYTTVYSNRNQRVFDGVRLDDEYENGELISVRVSNDLINSNPNNITLRFAWTSDYATNEAPYVWSTYGWFIDDVKISELPDNDLAILDFSWGYNGIPYFRIPEEVLDTLEFKVKVVNQGLNELSNVQFELDINQGDSVISTTPINLHSFDTAWLTINYLPHVNNLNFKTSVYSDTIDDIPSNNSFDSIAYVEVSTYYAVPGGSSAKVFARSEYRLGGQLNTELTQNGVVGESAVEVGNFYSTEKQQYLCGVMVGIGNDLSNAGQEIIATIYEYDTLLNQFNFINETPPYLILMPDVGGSPKLLSFESTISMESDKRYFVSFTAFSPITCNYSGTSAPGQSLISFGSTFWAVESYSIAQTPSIDLVLNDNPCVNSINELQKKEEGLLTNYPNPFEENTTIQFQLSQTEAVTLVVTNLSGQIVFEDELGVLQAGEHSLHYNSNGIKPGVYTYSIHSENYRMKNKMIIY